MLTRRSFFRRAATGALAAVAAVYVPNLVSATPLSAEQYAATGIARLIQTRREAAMQDIAKHLKEMAWGDHPMPDVPFGAAHWISDRVTFST